VCIEIEGANDLPFAEDDSYLLTPTDPEVVANIIELNDSDPDSDELTIISFDGEKVNVSDGFFSKNFSSGGVINVDPSTGNVTYDASLIVDKLGADDTFIETATYSISDGNGGTDQATVTFVVPGLNDCPEPNDDTAETRSDEGVSGNVLDNDDDPDPSTSLPTPILKVIGIKTGTDTINITGALDEMNVITLSSGAILSISPGGNYTYNPNGAFDGLDFLEQATDSFTYVVSDDICSVDANVTIFLYGDCECIPSATDEDGAIEVLGVNGTVSGVLEGEIEVYFFELDGNGTQVVFQANSSAPSGGGVTRFMEEMHLKSEQRIDTEQESVPKEEMPLPQEAVVEKTSNMYEEEDRPIPCRMGTPIPDVRQIEADKCDSSASPERFPLDILSRDAETVTFTLSQVWKQCNADGISNIDWLAADYVVPGGKLECFTTTNPGCGVMHTYTAKCTEGLALIDIYALDQSASGVFRQVDGSALQIPDACAVSDSSEDYRQACKFRYILSCMDNCERKEDSLWAQGLKKMTSLFRSG